jgi:hypothetical protein
MYSDIHLHQHQCIVQGVVNSIVFVIDDLVEQNESLRKVSFAEAKVIHPHSSIRWC